MRKKILATLKGIILVLLVSLAVDVAFFCNGLKPVVIISVLRFSGLSARYSKIMEVPVESKGKIVTCHLYQRDGSPFLLVGSYPFLEDQSDFFFVAKDFVRGRCLDEKTDDWSQILKWVWIDQDMDPDRRDSQVPYYSFRETRNFDQKTGNLTFTLSDDEDVPDGYKFSIPKRLIDALPAYHEP